MIHTATSSIDSNNCQGLNNQLLLVFLFLSDAYRLEIVIVLLKFRIFKTIITTSWLDAWRAASLIYSSITHITHILTVSAIKGVLNTVAGGWVNDLARGFGMILPLLFTAADTNTTTTIGTTVIMYLNYCYHFLYYTASYHYPHPPYLNYLPQPLLLPTDATSSKPTNKNC